MTEILVYAIRHIPTGKLMPVTRHARGSSYWTPDKVTPQGVPRLFPTRRGATNAMTAWLQGEWVPVWDQEDGCIGAVPEKRPERKKGDVEVISLMVVSTPVNPVTNNAS